MPSSVEVADLVAQLGPAYAQLGADQHAVHIDLLERVTADAPAAIHTVRRADGGWTLSVAAYDVVGTLATIAGMLTAARVNIEAADIFTLQASSPAGRRALDVFRVRADTSWNATRREQWERELAALMRMLTAGERDAARTAIVDRVAEVLRDAETADEQLWPVTVETVQSPEGDALRIRGQDTFGFLFALANAFALLDANITRAEIRTTAGESDDLLWVTGARGEPISDPRVLGRLRAAVALIKQFTLLLPHAPDPGQALREFGMLTRQLLARPDWDTALPSLASADVQRTLADLFGTSAFLWDDFLRMQYSNLFPLVGERTADPETRAALEQRLQTALREATDFAARKRALNAFKDREMFRIDLRFIRNEVDFRGFAAELSDLAEVVVSATAELVVQSLGIPPCAWAICALGKCGGRELGFASDVEVLFVYAEDDTPGSDANARYFEAFVRKFLDTLQTQREGIFEVDLRLRPHGNAGPLASSLSGLSAYYSPQSPARQFERMALVKLRPIAGDAALGARVEQVRVDYVYSGAPLEWDDVRRLRARQATELVQPGALNAKYSAGGLVDVEYWVQAQQIAAGAYDAAVRVPNTLLGIERLRAGEHIDAASAARLVDAYAFLRRLIDGLRVVHGNARDLAVPPQDSRAFAYLARRLDLEPDALATAIERHMGVARALWMEARG